MKMKELFHRLITKPKFAGKIAFLALLVIIIATLVILIYKVDRSRSTFLDVIPPYIAQSVYIKVYLTSSRAQGFQWVFDNNVKLKGTLAHNILVTSSDGSARVFVPKTLENIPVELHIDSSLDKVKIILVANDVEQEIQQCDLITTVY